MDASELRNGIEHILFVENEALFPMERFSELAPVVTQLAELMAAHAATAGERVRRETVYRIAGHLKDEVVGVVYREGPPTAEKEADDALYSW